MTDLVRLQLLVDYSTQRILRATNHLGFWDPDGFQLTYVTGHIAEGRKGFPVELTVTLPAGIANEDIMKLQARFVCPERYRNGKKVSGHHVLGLVAGSIAFFCARGHDHRIFFEWKEQPEAH